MHANRISTQTSPCVGWREQRDIGLKTAAVVAAAEQSHCGIVSLLNIFQLLKTSHYIRNKHRSLSHISLHTFTVTLATILRTQLNTHNTEYMTHIV